MERWIRRKLQSWTCHLLKFTKMGKSTTPFIMVLEI